MLLLNAKHQGYFQAVDVAMGVPQISHLLFAEDCFLFCRDSLNDCSALMSVLKDYETASSQQVSIDKSCIFFSANTQMTLRDDIMNFLGIHLVLEDGKYLGIPFMVGRSKKTAFTYLKDHIWNLVQCWRRWNCLKLGKLF